MRARAQHRQQYDRTIQCCSVNNTRIPEKKGTKVMRGCFVGRIVGELNDTFVI